MLARLRPHRRIIIAVAVAVNAILAVALARSVSAQPTAMACFSTQNCFCQARFACRVGGFSHQCTTNADCTT